MTAETLMAVSDLISKVGVPVAILMYFLWKDYKFTNKRIDIDMSISKSLALINNCLGIKEEGK